MRLVSLLFLPFLTARADVVTGAGGVDIHYARYGNGPETIVLVHGWTCDRSYWRAQIDDLADDHTILAIDLGGHGESGHGRDDWSMAAFGEDVAAVVAAEDPQSVILVGHSMGGPVVVEAALRLGDRVRMIIAVDTLQQPTRSPLTEEQSREQWAPFSEEFAPAVEAFVRRYFFLSTAPPEIVDQVATGMASADPDIALAAGHALTTWNVPEGIRAVSDTPFVLVNADYRPTDAEGLRAVHPRSRLVTLTGVGHFPMLIDPEGFNSVLRSLIETTPSR